MIKQILIICSLIFLSACRNDIVVSIRRTLASNTDSNNNTPSYYLAPSFVVGTGANNQIQSASMCLNGKIYAGGNFVSIDGNGANRIARLNADGSFDSTFVTGIGFDSDVHKVLALSDCSLLVGGYFSNYNSSAIGFIVKINSDGTLDLNFDTTGIFDADVMSMIVQPDGKILVFGDFTGGIKRLNSDGSVDATFNVGVGFDSFSRAGALLADGKVLVGGDLSTYQGSSIGRGIVRLNSDGSLDTSFVTGTGLNFGQVRALAVQDDGKYVVGGFFTAYDGNASNNIMRLNADGTFDTSFVTGTGYDNFIFTIKIQDDGKIIAGGWPTDYNGTTVNLLTRLETNGSIDNTFNYGGGIGFDWGTMFDVMLVEDKIFAIGEFNDYNGVTGRSIVRLGPTGAIE